MVAGSNIQACSSQPSSDFSREEKRLCQDFVIRMKAYFFAQQSHEKTRAMKLHPKHLMKTWLVMRPEESMENNGTRMWDVMP